MTKSAFSSTARLVVDLGSAQIKPLVSGGHRAKAGQRRQTGAAGQEGGGAPWCPDGFRQTAARVVRRTTPLECSEGDSITLCYQAATIRPVITEIQEHNISGLIAGFT